MLFFNKKTEKKTRFYLFPVENNLKGSQAHGFSTLAFLWIYTLED